MIETLVQIGCYRLWLGSESGSQRVLDAMRRGVKVEDVQAKSHLLRRHGIQVGMLITLGYEGETHRTSTRRRGTSRFPIRLARSMANAVVGRAGMLATAHEREPGTGAS